MTSRCLDLSDEAARDPSVAGAKAAGLARALELGLPVLPGAVVPVSEAAEVVHAASAALVEAGSGRARVAVMKIQPDPDLVTELRELVRPLGEPLIVRSSSPLEGDGVWSGAFSSFHGITGDDLATALRGCWGSAFSVGVLDRAEQSGTPPEHLGLAVLIQPEVQPALGGIARLLANGSVRITATRGPLRPLMSGEIEGESALVLPDGSVDTDSLDASVIQQVSELARRVDAQLGHQLIEWALADGELWLLQSLESRSTAVDEVTASPVESDPALATPMARQVAALVQRFPGRLADELVLPWAVACPRLADPAEVHGRDPVEAFAAARGLASHLIVSAWGGTPRSSLEETDRTLRLLRGDDPAAALERMTVLAAPTEERVAELLGLLDLVMRSVWSEVGSEAAFWRLSTEEVTDLLQGRHHTPSHRLGVDRWEPFLHGVVTAAGQSFPGTPAAPGAGAGRLHLVGDGRVGPPPPGRYVIVASQASPALSPLLWQAAGLVTRAGSTAAHVIEFAHSIGVPTVVGCDLPDLTELPGCMLAVDGDQGRVSIAQLDDD